MSKIEEEIIELINAQNENNQIDFKEKYYSNDKKYDLIKDVVAFANNTISKDKYIVFGIKNNSWDCVGINKSSLPDVSEINDLLHTYVEPFIDVEIGCFRYNGVTLGFLRIPYNNLDRPYVISKEYHKNNVTSLRKGEIYIRKGASNFVCDRNDLDNIYINRGSLDISFHTKEILINIIRINNTPHLMGSARLVLQNNTSKTITFDKMSLYINCESNLLEHNIEFCDNQKSTFSRMPESLSVIPIQISSGDCWQKTVFFSISEVAASELYIKATNSIKASIKIQDVIENKFQNEFSNVQLRFSADLLKKWET